MRKYKALFILSNTLSDEQLETKIEQISSEIVKLAGNVQTATRMGRITFARPISKKEVGIYVQLVFLMEPDKIKSLRERYRHNEDLIRLLIMAAKSPACNAMRSIAGRPDGAQVSTTAKKSNSAFVPSARSLGTTAK